MLATPAIPDAVLAAYGDTFFDFLWRPVRGGLSDALVFAGSSGDSSQPSLALKRWPPKTELVPLLSSHKHREHVQARCSFVPKLIANRHGRSFTGVDGLFWELSEWMPGSPDSSSSIVRMKNAAATIAELHRHWSAPRLFPVRNVLRDRINFINASTAECNEPQLAMVGDDLNHLCREALGQLRSIETPIPSTDKIWPQPVHGDLHREHILFVGDAVSGIIDFSSTKLDHPALDLARYFGDFEAIDVGVAAYRESGGSESVTPELVRFLDRVILLGSAAHWLKRFAADDVPAERRAAAIVRFERIVKRLAAANANAASASASIS